MAANQTSNQRSGSGNRYRATRAVGKPSQAEESTGDYGSIGEVAEQASNYVSRGMSQAGECVQEHPGAAVGVALATGLGVGLVVGLAIGRPRRQPRRWTDRITAEGIGRRLMERVEGMIPDVLAEHFRK